MDRNRCLRSKLLLLTTVDDTRRAERRLALAQERYHALQQEIPLLEERLAGLSIPSRLLSCVKSHHFVALQDEVDRKRHILTTAQDEAGEMIERINYNTSKKGGLCIRYIQLQPDLFYSPEISL